MRFNARPATQQPSSPKQLPDEYFNFRSKVHDRLLDTLDFSVFDRLDPETLRSRIRSLLEKILKENSELPLNLTEREKVLSELEDEVLGLGLLEPMLKDPTVSDILVNAYNQVYVERFGKLEPTNARFKDNQHLMRIIDKIVSAVGRRVDESNPMVDARLADGSRVNVIIPPLALEGPILSIRRFSVTPLEIEDLIRFKTVPETISDILRGLVQTRHNILIAGGTGSGKTTFLNILSRFIPEGERIITIEDAAELQLKQVHIVRLETRPPNIEGKGEVTQRDLVRNCLRMRPDRIVLGEVRGGEALDMLQAMNTGHDGSITTIHANSARDALLRLETMVSMANFDIPSQSIKKYISSAIDIIVHIARLSDGTRKMMSLIELSGMEGSVITTQEIVTFRQTGIGENGRVKGRFQFSGIRPHFMEKFTVAGVKVPPNLFDPSNILDV
ncbi:CpaF family protein [Desulfatiglans anilini]|uniref:CpaF family protein n=1 Tax=Desulfatiglans anilini TaxID=90728 RepID=UPI0006849734|nr:CpaF family protein [Desulfatiglans anilini]